jgi:hypothetical protein
MSKVFFSMLSPNDEGQVSDPVALEGEEFLRALVSEPAACVSALLGVEEAEWEQREAGIVTELTTAANDDARKAAKARIPGIVPGRYRDNHRSKGDCLGRQVVMYDFDHVVACTVDEAIAKVRALLPNIFLAVHTTATFRNADGTWRLRGATLMDREVMAGEWDSRVKPHMRSLGEQDEAAMDISRYLYLPVRTAGYTWRVFEGPRLRVDDLPVADAAAQGPGLAKAPAPAERPADATRARRKAQALALGAKWPAKGVRHLAKRALAGALLGYEHWSYDDAHAFMRDVYSVVDSDDGGNLEASVLRDTQARVERGQHVEGWATLYDYVDRVTVEGVRDTIGHNAEFKSMTDAREAELKAKRAANDAALATGEAPQAEGTSVAKPAPLGFEYGAWDTEPPPIDFLVDGLLPRGCVGMFFGRADALKTWILYSLAIACATGKPWLGRYHVKKAIKVGLVDFETGGANVRRRLYMLRAGACQNLGAISFPGVKPNTKAFWDAIEAEGFDLVIVDSLRKANPGAKENDSAESILPLTEAADFSEKTGASILFIHHATKSSDDGWPDFRGSSAIEDQVDCSFAVRKTDVTPTKKTIDVKCIKPGDMRTPDPFSVEVNFDDDARMATLKHTEAKSSQETEAADPEAENRAFVIRTLKANPTGVPKQDLLNMMKGAITTRRAVLSAMTIADTVREYKNQKKAMVMLNPNIET